MNHKQVFRVFLIMLISFPCLLEGQESKNKTKVLPLRVTSNKFSGEEISSLTEVIVSKLKKYPNIEVLEIPASDPMDMMVDAGCIDFDADCLSTIGIQRTADSVLYSEVNQKDGMFQIQMKYVDVHTKEMKSSEGGTEKKDKLSSFLGAALEKIFGPEPAKEPVFVKVDIDSDPAGAEVYIDRDFVGLTPLSLRLKTGSYGVRITKVGSKEVVDTLVLEPGKPVKKTYTLVAIEQPKVPSAPVKPTKLREIAGKPFYETWWFWTVVGAVVVGGVTTGVIVAKAKTAESATGSTGLRFDSSWAPWDHAIINK